MKKYISTSENKGKYITREITEKDCQGYKLKRVSVNYYLYKYDRETGKYESIGNIKKLQYGLEYKIASYLLKNTPRSAGRKKKPKRGRPPKN